MKIPVRVAANAAMTTVGGVRELNPGHRLFPQGCHVCDRALGTEPVTLVYVGVEPDDRKESGYMTGAAVAVHATCAEATG